MTEVAVESARQQWATGHRRVADQAADRNLYLRLLDEVGLELDELSRRVGQTFTLAELADAYRESDRWLLDVLGSCRWQIARSRWLNIKFTIWTTARNPDALAVLTRDNVTNLV